MKSGAYTRQRPSGWRRRRRRSRGACAQSRRARQAPLRKAARHRARRHSPLRRPGTLEAVVQHARSWFLNISRRTNREIPRSRSGRASVRRQIDASQRRAASKRNRFSAVPRARGGACGPEVLPTIRHSPILKTQRLELTQVVPQSNRAFAGAAPGSHLRRCV